MPLQLSQSAAEDSLDRGSGALRCFVLGGAILAIGVAARVPVPAGAQVVRSGHRPVGAPRHAAPHVKRFVQSAAAAQPPHTASSFVGISPVHGVRF